jgi:hypothetical protein
MLDQVRPIPRVELVGARGLQLARRPDSDGQRKAKSQKSVAVLETRKELSFRSAELSREESAVSLLGKADSPPIKLPSE